MTYKEADELPLPASSGPHIPKNFTRSPPRIIRETNVSSTLGVRQKIHGDYAVTADIIQRLKADAKESPNWNRLTAVQKESIEMVLRKIGRVLSGDPNHPDHWHDIQGYAKLAEDNLDDGQPF